MRPQLSRLADDPAFRKNAQALRGNAKAPDIEPVLDHFKTFAGVRRREARIALLQGAERIDASDWSGDRQRLPQALAGFAEVVNRLSRETEALRPVIGKDLDSVLTLAAGEKHPLRDVIRETSVSMGFSAEEVEWQLKELEAVQFSIADLLDADDLQTILSSVSLGENGLLMAGFVRFTGDEKNDERLERIIIRLREKGVTASIFLVFVVVLTAYAATAEQ